MRANLRLALLIGALCPAIVAAQTAAPAAHPPLLNTRPGWEVGGQIAYYKYEEPGIMKLSGNRAGAAGIFTFANAQHVFWRVDMRLSHGLLYYESQGTGTQNDVPDWLTEARFVAGRDFSIGQNVVLAPYGGIGYRYLYNDLRGVSSTGALGYRRYSRYLYLPLGITARFGIGRGWVFAPNLELDVFLQGKQRSQLADTGIAGLMNATNTQNSGRGYRWSLMFENGLWSFGPWLHYWKVRESDIVPIGNGLFSQEPKNTTREAGLEVRYRF